MAICLLEERKKLRYWRKKSNLKDLNWDFFGRRRIGKTRLLLEIVNKYQGIYYVANEMGLEYNLKQLSAVVATYYNESFTFENFE